MKTNNAVNKSSRLLAMMLCVVLLISSITITVGATELDRLDADSLQTDTLLLVDTSSGEVLYSKNSNQVRPLASTTKIMTYIVAVENIADLANEMIEITSQPINDVISEDMSTCGLNDHIGESYSALDILYGMMLPSGCDASQILAYHVGKTPEKFAEMMTQKAKELGCENTYFAEAHGATDENYTTAEDMVKITKHALTLPYFREMVSTEYYTAENYTYPFINTNYLIDVENGREYYYRYATGVKTGFTTKAGKCLVSTAQKGDTEYMCIALGSPYTEADGYINHAMTDSIDLYKWAFSNFTDNIDVEINNSYASVEIDKSITLNASVTENTTNETPIIEWTTSDESVATVDENGVVTAKSMGQAVITAKSQTGNFDTVAVSCGFYNGIDVTSRYGDYSTGSKNPVDWKAVKDYGFDYSVIRAGWGWEDFPYQNDAEFVNNVKGSYKNSIPFFLSFVAYAGNEEEAQAEADYFLREMKEYFPQECADGMLSVVYNMTDSSFSSNDKSTNTEIALAFANKLKENGYKTVVFANKSVYKKLDTNKLIQNSVGTYYSYYPYEVDFSNPIDAPDGFIPQMWQFRSDGYIPQASEKLYTKQCLTYMLSSFADELSAPILSAKLSGNNDVVLSWTSEDYPADSYTVYEISDNGEKTLVVQLNGDVQSYTHNTHIYGEHHYIVEKNMVDMISAKKLVIESADVAIKTYHPLDVNRDGYCNIMDATYIQKVLAQIIDAEDGFDVYGDVNNDGQVSIADATEIQKVLAQLVDYNCQVR